MPTVQGLLLVACRTLLGDTTKVIGASRTDAGVHALRQVVSIATDGMLRVEAVGRALNAMLPHDIRVRAVCDAPEDFDAGAVASPFLRRYAWHVPVPLDLAAMRAALALVRGTHDFGAFCAAAGREAMPRCRVRAVHVVRHRSSVAILVSADRFLHHMVRNLVGSAVAVGRGARAAAWMGDVLASGDRRLAGATAPAHGLTLVRVLY